MRSLTVLYSSNNLRYYIESYCKASFIKVPDIIFMNAIFLNSFIYSFKALFYNLWILLLCMLVCNPLIISCT
jgi:hypothetical protein